MSSPSSRSALSAVSGGVKKQAAKPRARKTSDKAFNSEGLSDDWRHEEDLERLELERIERQHLLEDRARERAVCLREAAGEPQTFPRQLCSAALQLLCEVADAKLTHKSTSVNSLVDVMVTRTGLVYTVEYLRRARDGEQLPTLRFDVKPGTWKVKRFKMQRVDGQGVRELTQLLRSEVPRCFAGL